jgi:hypothetical protein
MSTDTAVVTDRDGSRTYTHPVTGQVMLSVTTVISATQSKPWLAPWQVRLSLKWALDNLDRLTDDSYADEVTKARAKDPDVDVAAVVRQAFTKEAKAAGERARDLKADTGSYTHAVIESLILWAASPGSGADITLPTIPDHLVGQYIDGPPEPGETGVLVEDFADIAVTGFTAFVADLDPQFESAEMRVFNPALGVAGTLDMIASFPSLGRRSCVDVKTGKHLMDAPEQLSVYRRMTECQMPMGEMVAMPPTDSGMVLHLRPEYPKGYRLMEVSRADDEASWNAFRRALLLLQERNRRKPKPGRVLYPPLPDGSQPTPLLADLDGEPHGRVRNPLIRALGPDARVGDLAGFTDDDLLAIKGVGPKALDDIHALLTDHGFTGDDQEGEVA